jgi:hypothetical protein
MSLGGIYLELLRRADREYRVGLATVTYRIIVRKRDTGKKKFEGLTTLVVREYKKYD